MAETAYFSRPPSVDGSGHALPATNNQFFRSHVRGDADPLWPAAHASTVAHIRTGQSISAKLHLSGLLGLAADSLKYGVIFMCINV